MTTWIALFRGINVGGNNLLPMKSLVALLEKLGYEDVATYIQSGNAVFRSSEKAKDIENAISAAIAKAYGFAPRVLLLTSQELQKVTVANPFPNAESNYKSLHVFFLASTPKRPNLAEIGALKSKSESFVLTPRAFHLHAPDGVGNSKLAARVEKCLGVDATARNWRTVTRVSELANHLD